MCGEFGLDRLFSFFVTAFLLLHYYFSCRPFMPVYLIGCLCAGLLLNCYILVPIGALQLVSPPCLAGSLATAS